MDSYDIKKALPTLYAPKPGDLHVVEVPELSFLMIDGHGDPNVSPAYADAVAALFVLSYAVRAIAKSELARVHTVGPLEGLWSAEDPGAFVAGDKSAWDWTMMISQPAWITPDLVGRATQKAQKKAPAALDRVRSCRTRKARASRSCTSDPTTPRLPSSRGSTTSTSRNTASPSTASTTRSTSPMHAGPIRRSYARSFANPSPHFRKYLGRRPSSPRRGSLAVIDLAPRRPGDAVVGHWLSGCEIWSFGRPRGKARSPLPAALNV